MVFVTCCVQELKLKDEECKKLGRVHEQMSEELEELTAKLFEVGNTLTACRASSWAITKCYSFD